LQIGGLIGSMTTPAIRESSRDATVQSQIWFEPQLSGEAQW
jgi:hypothetical protein